MNMSKILSNENVKNVNKYYSLLIVCVLVALISTAAIAKQSNFEIKALSHLTVNTTSATVYWTTNEKATGFIEYGENDAFDKSVGKTNTSKSKIHAYSLKNLKPGTKYKYRLKVKSEDGKQAASDSKTFNTTAGSSNSFRQAALQSRAQPKIATPKSIQAPKVTKLAEPTKKETVPLKTYKKPITTQKTSSAPSITTLQAMRPTSNSRTASPRAKTDGITDRATRQPVQLAAASTQSTTSSTVQPAAISQAPKPPAQPALETRIAQRGSANATSKPFVLKDEYKFDELFFNSDFANQPQQLTDDLAKRYPGKDLPDGTKWRHELMRGNSGGQYVKGDRKGKRWLAWYDRGDRDYDPDKPLVNGMFDPSRIDYFLDKTYVDTKNGYLVQKGLVDYSGGRDGSKAELHASWLDTFSFDWFDDVKGHRPVTPNDLDVDRDSDEKNAPDYLRRSPNIMFEQNTYFEIEVNFEDMYSPGHRHSIWLMPAMDQKGKILKDAAFNSNPADGMEIDIYEHEHTGNHKTSEIMYMKAIGGEQAKGGAGDTINEIPAPSDKHYGWSHGQIPVKDINKGWHTIGFLWTNDKNGPAMRWFVNGKLVVKDTKRVPEDIKMFMIMSREITNGTHALNHFNARDYEKDIADSAVKIKHVRAWKVSPK